MGKSQELEQGKIFILIQSNFMVVNVQMFSYSHDDIESIVCHCLVSLNRSTASVIEI
jgi:predicted protein tyrosine phosphatase